MYKPWKPVDRILSTHPSIGWCVESRTVVLSWSEWLNNKCQFEMEVTFEEGLAGIFCFDESSYETVTDSGLPNESEFNHEGFEPIPWPAWISKLNYRKHIYGLLGETLYENMYSYYFVGSETVLLIDVADSEPIVNVKKS